LSCCSSRPNLSGQEMAAIPANLESISKGVSATNMNSAFSEQELAIIRRAFARQMLCLAGANDDSNLREAFSAIKREKFLGPSPWKIVLPAVGYADLVDADPAIVYQDVLFGLSPERGVNNGSPSLHARWMHAANIKPGERVVHIGAGSGYYTAILAHLVGAHGRVTAVEFDPKLADAARRNLSDLRNVTVVQGDGADWPAEPADCVYVNYCVGRPALPWLDQLSAAGRLLFPLGVAKDKGLEGGQRARFGAALLVSAGPGNGQFHVSWLGPAFFVCAEDPSARQVEEHETLTAAFERGGIEFVKSLRWRQSPSPDRSWFMGGGWSLGFDEP
jgi:protein-L-isoaspartate(D-aspartate) O-methyltransferase